MDDLLWRHLRDLPAFRALLRAVEARFYADLPLPRPVLDLGCGDGHFASVAFDEPLEAGFDPWWGPLTEARGRGAYRLLAQAEGSRMPYPDNYFAAVVSNSVLEHIPQVQPVLAEVARVLQPNGIFYFCVPGPNFLPFLSIGRALDRLWPLHSPFSILHSPDILHSPGEAYRRFFNRISRHYHCDGAEVWERRLEATGLQLVRWWPYFSRRALTALEWGHYLGLPTLVCKKLTGRWILSPTRANLWLTEHLLRPLYKEPLPQEGACLFLVARKPE
ncbi:MAG: class I SAM-dependent methyltransferase [Anaerolineae bacterium]|nr:class I SAM-dependent methyltransferase [Anaerolineae bacterium]